MRCHYREWLDEKRTLECRDGYKLSAKFAVVNEVADIYF